MGVHIRHWPWYMPVFPGDIMFTLRSYSSPAPKGFTDTIFMGPSWSPEVYFRKTPMGHALLPGKKTVTFRASNSQRLASVGEIDRRFTRSCSKAVLCCKFHLWYKSMLWSVDTLSKRASADQCHLTVLQAKVYNSLRWHVFLQLRLL